MRQLGEPGGFGTVYELLGTSTVFKEYNSEARNSDAIRWAEKSVSFWKGLSRPEQDTLATMAAWPTDLVVERGKTIGVLMPRIPDNFFHTRIDFKGARGSFPNELGWLMQEHAKLDGRFDADALRETATRVVILARLVYALRWLHERGVVFGDVSARNCVFSLEPLGAMLLDCDAVAVPGGSQTAQGRSTPFYFPPELTGPRAQLDVDTGTDVWKVGILMLRALTPGRGALQRQPKNIRLLQGSVPQPLIDVVGSALHQDRAQRPSMRSMYRELYQIVDSMTSPPRASILHLTTEVCVRGDDLAIVWHFPDVQRIRITGSNGLSIDLDARKHPNGFRFVPTASGEIVVEASNRFGTTVYVLGPVRLYDMPEVSFGFDRLLSPLVPTLPTLSDTAWEALQAVGAVRQEFPSLPVELAPAPTLDASLWHMSASHGAAVGQQVVTSARALVSSFAEASENLTSRLEDALRR